MKHQAVRRSRHWSKNADFDPIVVAATLFGILTAAVLATAI
jgi:hypothetical protein